MEKLGMLAFGIYFTLHVFVTLTVESYSSTLDTSKVVVAFKPRVSILDGINSSRYIIGELDPLITKVATRFKKVLIELNLTEHLKTGKLTLPEKRESNLFGAVAAAKYNCHPSTKHKIEVILYLSKYTQDSCDCFKLLKKPFEDFADEANYICHGTVTTILVSYFQFCDFSSMSCTTEELNAIAQNDLIMSRYKWGVVTSFEVYCKYGIRSANLYWDPAVVLLVYESNNDMQIDLTQCKSYKESFSKPVEFIQRIDYIHKLNMSNLVSEWQRRISELPKDSYIFLHAFDNHGANGGWWFLDYDLTNTNTNGFVFRERIQVASEVDSEEDPRNFDWLKEQIMVNVNSTGIISTRDTYNKYISQSGFCRVILNDYELKYKLTALYKDLSEENNNCVSTRKVIYFANFNSDRDFDVEFKHNNITLLVDRTKNFKIPNLKRFHTKYDGYYMKKLQYTKVLQDLETSGAEYGYAFSIKVCHEYSQLDESSQALLFDILRNLNSKMNVFYYKEDEFKVQTAARQMFIRRITLFAMCKKMVLESGNNISEIGFAMQGYYRVDDFHRSPWALQNYVKYVKMMNKWAGGQTNTVVYLGTLRDGEENGSPVVGWLTLDSSRFGFTTKQQDALKLSELYYPEPTSPNITRVEVETSAGLNANQIVIVIFVGLAICLVIIFCSAFFIRAYYKKDELSKEEMDMFFIGNDLCDLDADKVPYDQNKYEIPDEEFSFDKNEPLGCGEFGMVFRGIIKNSDEERNVAVKSINVNTRHKTTLKGLLSEIKVLAHVGKHANIIELLGANTSSLKDGNVFIFLELCPHGSLEKYLRDQRSIENFSTEEVNFDSPNIGKAYIAISELTRDSLKKSVCDDLYRWSTEICNGMAYLAEKHVVHADLATRNVLLTSSREAKICDFGLSRRMYNYTNYVKTGQEPLPWKWMAPEALRYMKFSEKTDVWSFGVTLWEIYSLGSLPYPGLSWDLNFPQMLERGFRLAKPEFVERDMYRIMQSCWKTDPEHRLAFSDIFSMMAGTDSE